MSAERSLPRLLQLSSDLVRAVRLHQDDKTESILHALEDELTDRDLAAVSTRDLTQTLAKLKRHRNAEIANLAQSLLFKCKQKVQSKRNGNRSNSHSEPQLEHKQQEEAKTSETMTVIQSAHLSERGSVYIASMARGKTWPKVQRDDGKVVEKRINVTSGSNNKINGACAKNVSPMFLGPVHQSLLQQLGVENPKNDDVEALLFENYWQYGKLFRGLGHLDTNDRFTEQWLLFRRTGYAVEKGHRHPKGTKTSEVRFIEKRGSRQYNRYRYHIACSSYYFGQYMDYVTSRKRVYCPLYEALASNTKFYQELRKAVCNGLDVAILDFDGPRGVPYLKVTLEMLQQKINDTSAPFGHGYVFAAMIAGIASSEYCQS